MEIDIKELKDRRVLEHRIMNIIVNKRQLCLDSFQIVETESSHIFLLERSDSKYDLHSEPGEGVIIY